MRISFVLPFIPKQKALTMLLWSFHAATHTSAGYHKNIGCQRILTCPSFTSQTSIVLSFLSQHKVSGSTRMLCAQHIFTCTALKNLSHFGACHTATYRTPPDRGSLSKILSRQAPKPHLPVMIFIVSHHGRKSSTSKLRQQRVQCQTGLTFLTPKLPLPSHDCHTSPTTTLR